MKGARERLRELLVQRSLLPGPITLSNGQTADYYFDCKRVTLIPEGGQLVADVFLEVIESLPEQPEAIGGLTHGADPILGAVMMRALERGRRLETFYVRKEPKKHGTKQWIENPPRSGTKVVIVDDVITSGKSAIQAIEHAVNNGCTVVAVVALVDREQGGAEALLQRAKTYVPIFRLADFPEIASLRQRKEHVNV
jgi:orotate phosphoribosyltransferase